ncbi:NADPH-dependent FMN reductase [Mycobacterium seoulense]|uniref:NADPH-dependent FMN reductase n=1 Tax=Mycobacterium seoulense TaxID=386911 RepID=UPI003CF66188
MQSTDQRTSRIIAFAGSLRTDSNNKKLARAMAAGAELAGAEVRFLDLREYPVPVLDADLFDAKNSDPHRLFEEGGRVGPSHEVPLPEGLLRLKQHVQWADGFLIATPEYGGSIPGMLKNLIDWLTRLAPGEAPLDNFTYKIVARACICLEGNGHGALAELTRLLTTLGAVVLPGNDVFYVDDNLFDEDGQFRDQVNRDAAEAIGRRLNRAIVRFNRLSETG